MYLPNHDVRPIGSEIEEFIDPSPVEDRIAAEAPVDEPRDDDHDASIDQPTVRD
jgi:hypothetical protein